MADKKNLCLNGIFAPNISTLRWRRRVGIFRLRFEKKYLLLMAVFMVKGNLSTRGKRKRADYILYYKPNIPIAIIEAKDN